MSAARFRDQSTILFWAAVAIFFALHLYKISAPPNGYHQFRESDTAAIALNYYQEDMSFLKPRVNQRGTTSGITGSELPLYNYTVALVYSALGPSHAWARLLTIFAACVSLWLLWRIVTILTDRVTALFSVWAMAFSPLLFFYSFKIMPDIWMLTFLLGAVLLFVKHLKTGMYGFLLLSSACLILSACIKPLGLSIYLVFFYLAWRKREGRTLRLVMTALYALVTFAATYGWFVHARSVNEVHGGSFFYMGQRLELFWDDLLAADFYKKLFLQWPFELWVGYLLVPAFFYGCYRAIGELGGKIYLVWLAACYIVFAIVSSHSYSHDYYTLVIIPPLAVVTGIGLKGALRSGGWKKHVLIGLCLLAPLGAVGRTFHRIKDVDDFDKLRNDANRLIVRGSPVMIEDITPCIRLYQINRTGWPLRRAVDYSVVEALVKKGGEYLILEHPLETYDDSLALLFEAAPERISDLYCYRVRNKFDRLP